MAFDVEELKFHGMIHRISEEDFSASVTDDTDQEFVKMLYQQYIAAGKPKNKREWIRQELKQYFLSVTSPPVWIERATTPVWPFCEGRPMVFIDQLTVPQNEVSESVVYPGTVLYIFGGKKPVKDVAGGWEMIFRVVEQVPDL